MRKERDASELEKLAHDGERNIHRLCDQLLVNGRQVRVISIISAISTYIIYNIIYIIYNIVYLQRGDVQRDREREEARVAEMAQNLERYKREVGE